MVSFDTSVSHLVGNRADDYPDLRVVKAAEKGAKLEDRQYISVAPDTHVIQASEKLGLITHDELEKPNIREKVSFLWEDHKCLFPIRF